MLASPDRLQDPLALHLLLQAAQGLLEGLIFTNFNDWHVSMLLHRANRVKPRGPSLRFQFGTLEGGLVRGSLLKKLTLQAS